MRKSYVNFLSNLERRMRMRNGRETEAAETVRAILRPIESNQPKSINDDIDVTTPELREAKQKR